jgi:hypothetical protein
MISGYNDRRCFSIQARGPWRRVVDTGLESPEDVAETGEAPLWGAREYSSGARSVVVLVRDSGSHVGPPTRE